MTNLHQTSMNSEYITSRASHPSTDLHRSHKKKKAPIDPGFAKAISKYVKQPGHERKKAGGFRCGL